MVMTDLDIEQYLWCDKTTVSKYSERFIVWYDSSQVMICIVNPCVYVIAIHLLCFISYLSVKMFLILGGVRLTCWSMEHNQTWLLEPLSLFKHIIYLYLICLAQKILRKDLYLMFTDRVWENIDSLERFIPFFEFALLSL